MRFATLLEGVYADGWMVNDASFTQYASSTAGPDGYEFASRVSPGTGRVFQGR